MTGWEREDAGKPVIHCIVRIKEAGATKGRGPQLVKNPLPSLLPLHPENNGQLA